MKFLEQQAYDTELKRVARRLGLPRTGNIEEAIIRYCHSQVAAWIKEHGQPITLSELSNLFATSLSMGFEEIHNEADLEDLLKRIPPKLEPIMARLQAEFDEDTDAIIVRRNNQEPWENPFLAVINCQDWHAFRRFFTKWHEIVHRLVEGQQLRFAFRHTRTYRPEPEEILVDRITAVIAFYPDIFQPVFYEELHFAGRLTFEVIDKTRNKIAPDASREATILACLRCCPCPVWFVRSKIGYKRIEEQILASPQMSLIPDYDHKPKAKLRVREAACSPVAGNSGIRIHQNMRIPDNSIITQAFQDPLRLSHTGSEQLHTWQTSSSGPIGHGVIDVEAIRVSEEVWAFVHMRSD